jgi:thymidylate synthase (FAD)
MDLTPYVNSLREDLLAAAAAGDEQTRRTAALLVGAIEPAARLTMLHALSDMASEVTESLEHGTVTFYLTGVSRSLTHELIRHRHFSYSQLSQRYVPGRGSAVVEPDVIADDPQLHAAFVEAAEAAEKAYDQLLSGLEERFADEPNATLRRKQARQAARAVLPNATETKIVVTGNYRAWRHFIAMRATEHADVEIRELAIECLRHLQVEVANVFADFEINKLADGTEVASSPMVSEG